MAETLGKPVAALPDHRPGMAVKFQLLTRRDPIGFPRRLPLYGIGRDKQHSVFPGRHALVLPKYPVEAGNTLKSGMHRNLCEGHVRVRQELRRFFQPHGIQPLVVVHPRNAVKDPGKVILVDPGQPGHGALGQIVRRQVIFDIIRDHDHAMRGGIRIAVRIAIYNYASSMQRALGDSRTPLYFLVLSCLLNVGLDLLFVGSFGLGVFGAALATMLSQLLAGAGSLWYAFRRNPYFHINRESRAFDREITKSAVRLGLPLALQWSLIAISTTALQSVVNSFGATAMAAYTATNRLEQLVQQPFGSMGMALSTYAGQNKGAGKIDRIQRGLKDGLLAMVAVACVMTLIMQLFGESLVGMFVHEEDVIALGGRALKITSLFYAFLGVIYVTRGVLNGVGDAFFSFVNGVVEIAGRVGLPFLLLHFTSAGVWSIWITAGVTWLLAGTSCVLRYISWRKKQGGAKDGSRRHCDKNALASQP